MRKTAGCSHIGACANLVLLTLSIASIGVRGQVDQFSIVFNPPFRYLCPGFEAAFNPETALFEFEGDLDCFQTQSPFVYLPESMPLDIQGVASDSKFSNDILEQVDVWASSSADEPGFLDVHIGSPHTIVVRDGAGGQIALLNPQAIEFQTTQSQASELVQWTTFPTVDPNGAIVVSFSGQVLNTTLLEDNNVPFVHFQFNIDPQTTDLMSLCIDQNNSYFIVEHPATGNMVRVGVDIVTCGCLLCIVQPPEENEIPPAIAELCQGKEIINMAALQPATNTIVGSDASECILGTDGDDTIYGGNGDDLIFGLSGNDVLNGGDGVDTIYGGLGKDILLGNQQGDILYGEVGPDMLFGQLGDDVMYGGLGPDTLYGGPGMNSIYTGLGADTVFGCPENNSVQSDSNVEPIIICS